jgi:hypothetical protein
MYSKPENLAHKHAEPESIWVLGVPKEIQENVAMDGLNSPINEKMSALCMWYPVCLFPTAWRVGGDDEPGETGTTSNAGCK